MLKIKLAAPFTIGMRSRAEVKCRTHWLESWASSCAAALQVSPYYAPINVKPHYSYPTQGIVGQCREI